MKLFSQSQITMNKFKIIIGSIFFVFQVHADDCVGIHVDTKGLVTKIIPFYKSPNLTDWKGNDSTEIRKETESKQETKLSKFVVDVKKPLSGYEKEIERLLLIPPMNIPIKSCPLHAAIRLCAEAAKMSYIAPSKEYFNDTVTLKVYASPYEILTMFTEHYGLGMEYERGIWHFYKINENELITRKYQLLYNNQEVIKIDTPEFSKNRNHGIKNHSGGNESLFIDTNTIIKEIQKILSLPTTGLEAVIESGGSVNNFSKISTPSLLSCTKNQEAPIGKVIYISDTNQLMIIATRQQHSYIQAYLESVDKPQRLIKIEAKFVETSLDPKTEIGIDWSNISGTKISLKEVKADIVKSLSPATALLSAQDLAIQFNFIRTDSDSTIVHNPQLVTTNNRAVSLKSVVQQPIESSTNNQNTATGSSTKSTIDFVEIGTIINIFPQIMGGSLIDFGTESIQLNVSIVVSSIVGEKEIRGNSYPIVSSRTYDYTVIVPSGCTLAIGGLSESSHITTQSKVPLLGDIPILGYAFRNKKDKQSKRNLIAYITPTILNSRSKEIEKNCL